MEYPLLAGDQLGRTLEISAPPRRIISLVPSQTELLFDLGIEDSIAGITKFCVHPESMFRNKPRIGGTKALNFSKIQALKPDLIIGNKEENQKEQVEELMKEYPVWMSDIKTLDDALDMVLRIGNLVNREQQAKHIAEQVKEGFEALHAEVKPFEQGNVAYFIWKKPYMTVGSDTFISDMLSRCGLHNVFDTHTRYPEVSEEMLRAASPDLIFLSSEPYPFKEIHFEEFRNICPKAKVVIVDGEIFSWYGSRMLQAPGYFRELLKALE